MRPVSTIIDHHLVVEFYHIIAYNIPNGHYYHGMNSLAQRQPEPAQQLPYRVRLLQKAVPTLPVTAEGLPIGFYRVDLLPEQSPGDAKEEAQALRNAYINLCFDHGYPTLSDGRPFWYKLDYEPGFAFGAFQIYLEANDTGPRELSLLADNEEIRRLAGRMYQLNKQSTAISGIDTEELPPVEAVTAILMEFSILYLWRARAKAHDLYEEAAYRHLKLRRQTSIENEHYLLAVSLMTKLKEKMLNSPNFFEDMSAKTATELLSKLVAIQRISVGLPAAGPLPNKEQSEDISFEMIMRTLAQKTAKGNVFDQSGREVTTENALSKVLEDPRAAGMMQEVIIRVSKAAQKPTDSQGHRFKSRNRSNEIITDDDLTAPFDIEGAPNAGENMNLDDNQIDSSGNGTV
jgi:hypothetical protein